MELADAERRLEEVAGSRRPATRRRAEAEQAVRRTSSCGNGRRRRVGSDAGARRGAVADRSRSRPRRQGSPSRLRRSPGEVSEVPRLSDSGRSAPGTSLAEIDEWGARAHAALFVVRGGLESEREKVVLEAHALAAGGAR